MAAASRTWRLVTALVLFLAAERCVAEEGHGAKAVHIDLKSQWPYTPLTLEASEFLGEQASEYFWRFIDAIKGPVPTNETQEYHDILRAAGSLLTPLKTEMLKYALRTRYYSARVEMHRQIAAEEASLRNAGDLPSTFVVVGDKLAKTVAELRDLIPSISSLVKAQKIASLTLPKEHVYKPDSVASDAPTVVLYGQIGSAEFTSLDADLRKAATERGVRYVVRHLPTPSERRVSLQGWSAELALKNMEYKAVDDSQAAATPAAQELRMPGDEQDNNMVFATTAAEDLRDTLTPEGDILIGQMKASELATHGLAAAQSVISSANPLATLRELSSNYPSVVATLSKARFQEQVRVNASDVQRMIGGNDILVLNGRVLRPNTIDPFTLLDIVATETDKFERVRSLNIGTRDALKVLAIAPAKDVSYRFDLRSPNLVWLNDMERDEMYAGWPKSMKTVLFKGGWPGSPRYVAKNMFSAVVVGSLTSDLVDVIMVMQSYVRQNLPLRFGVLLHTPEGDEVAAQAHKAFLWLAKNTETRVLRSFMSTLYTTLHENDQPRPLTTELLLFVLHTARGIPGSIDPKKIFADPALDDQIKEMNQAIASKGIAVMPATFINGLLLRGEGRALYDQILTYSMDYDSLVQLIYNGQISDSTDLFEYFSSLPECLPRVNPYVFPSRDRPLRFVSLASRSSSAAWSDLTQEQRTARVLSKRKYVSPLATEDDVKRATHLLVLDFASLPSLRVAHAALTYLAGNNAPLARVGFLFAASKDTEAKARAVVAALSTLRLKRSLPFLIDYIGDLIGVAATGSESWRDTLASAAIQDRLNSAAALADDEQLFLEDRAFIATHLAAPADQLSLMCNGRVLTFPASAPLSAEDFALLEKVEWAERTSRLWPVVDAIDFVNVAADDLTSDFRSDVLMKLVSVMGADQQAEVDKLDNSALPQLPVSFEVNSESDNDGLSVFAVIDPLGKNAHRVAPLLLSLLDHFRVHVKVVLNPRLTYTELPLKTYHRYAMAAPHFADDTVPGVVFTSLPSQRLLTLAVDVLESWLIRASVARYDMDNIKLADIGERVVHAEFELRNILVQGHCHDASGQYGPRGLELALGTRVTPHMQDTIVMSNLGYFQLKANPTAWQLELVGRGAELYDVVKVDGTPFAPSRPIFISGFHGAWLTLDVKKKAGREADELLAEDAGKGLWGTMKGLFNNAQPANETIHVFSVATGHLYERFLRIMVLTVLKNTKNPVKFWFLANYLSPRFIDVIPAMAAKYNFQYELVTYKWPAWLNKQTEKQRIIWAYKILFLDVLFPLNVKKIIYVDADQIVRTDLRELTEIDLHGAPYGFTPFCDDKPEMNGFRFWKSGFWKDHLKEKPYHISALYVVDLARLRRIGAADQLRATYDSLSRDPGSLANLDQDLPNFLQMQVPIFSLPQEWLWCETWCSDASKEKAKTIDLCNNPLTKIPKLDNAHKVIGKYWSELDEEQRKVELEVVAKLEKGGN